LGGDLVVGHVGVQAPAASQDTVTYVVVPSAAETSDTRTALGRACDVFTAVPIKTDSATNKVTVYETGGKNCTVSQRVELPAKDIKAVNPSPSPTPSKK
jgi:hypothetical protein